MENEVFLSFVFYSTLLILKMYILAIITGQIRLRKKAFANPEDALRHGSIEYFREDPDVERYRSKPQQPTAIRFRLCLVHASMESSSQ
ncbi:prostaglandin E synthase isoform X2 [Pseudophryne corroboree]|uniref:prostaglandin E synthase isoform X2 n=1 Tax=Pseudophryne corroboree TaxID=495146 RepID=UPI003081A2EC